MGACSGRRAGASGLASASLPQWTARGEPGPGYPQTDDFERDHARFAAAGVTFLEAPRHEPYGTVAVCTDPCGNSWDLIGPRRG